MWKKRIISLVMCIVLTIGLVFVSNPTDVKAISQTEVVNQLNSMISQYNGKTATSSQMYMGIQCKGFANWVFLNIFGVYIGPYPESANYKITNPNAQTIGIIEPGNLNADTAKALLQKGAPGDYIQVQRSTARGQGPHSMILYGMNDNGIEVFDCNSDGKNTIKKYFISWADFDVANRAMSLYRANGYSPSYDPPTNPQISKNQMWFDRQDTVTLYGSAEGATNYHVVVDDAWGLRLIDQEIEGNSFSFPASRFDEGTYWACMIMTNAAGGVQTEWIEIPLVGVPGYNDVWTSKWQYDLTDTVKISVSTVCAKGQFIGIDKEGVGRVITEETDSTYEIEASKLGAGKYSAYFSVYNGSGGIDTKRVEFVIGNKLTNPAISIESDKYGLNEEIVIGASADGGVEYYTAKIYDDKGNEILSEDFAGNEFSVDASKLGKGIYTAKVVCSNYAFSVETEVITFEVVCNHSYTSKITMAATCDASGVRTYTCSICGDTYTETIKATGHKYKNTVVAPTENENGYTIHTCTVCQYSYKDTYTNALGHEYSLVESKDAQCTADGYKKYKCSDCGEEYTETIPATGHNYSSTVINPTCTEKGYTVHKCSNCEDNYKDTYVNAKNHEYKSSVTTEAGCTTDGLMTYTCKNCNEKKTSIIAANGHSYNITTVEPTCENQGYTLHKCEKCGNSYKDSYTDAREHNYVSYVLKQATCQATGTKEHACENCGDSYTEVLQRTEHSYSKNITKYPTCTSEGTAERVCSMCKDTYTEMIPKIEHEFVQKIVEATCSDKGYTANVCNMCGLEQIKEYTEATNIHSYNVVQVVPPTYDEEGYTLEICTICGNEIKTNIVPKLEKVDETDKVDETKENPSNQVSETTSNKVDDATTENSTNSNGTVTNSQNKQINNTEENSSNQIGKVKKIKLKAKKKKIIVKWKKVPKASGYVIQYSTNKKMKKAKKVIVKSSKAKYTIKKLKSKKKYYVRMRVFVKVGDTKVYGAYGKAKKVKTK